MPTKNFQSQALALKFWRKKRKKDKKARLEFIQTATVPRYKVHFK